MVICLVRDADLHMAQRIPLPLTVSCFSKIQIGFTFLLRAHRGGPGQRAVKRVCVCVCDYSLYRRAKKTDSTVGRSDKARLPPGRCACKEVIYSMLERA